MSVRQVYDVHMRPIEARRKIDALTGRGVRILKHCLERVPDLASCNRHRSEIRHGRFELRAGEGIQHGLAAWQDDCHTAGERFLAFRFLGRPMCV